jgi:glycosyltransferase involved in cell wall biosynthesis
MKVSIGVPVFNGGEFLRETLDSILAQDYTDFELIISDNASTDNTEEICRDYRARDSRIRYVRQSENIGGYNNYKFLLDSALGEYFMWSAADDYLHSATDLKKLVMTLEQGYEYVFPEVDILYSETGETLKNIMLPFQKVANRYGYARASLIINSYQVYGLFRISTLREFYHYIDECKNMKCYNEGLFVHAISTQANGCLVVDARRIYRRHKNNWSSAVPTKQLLIAFLEFSYKTIKYFANEKSLSIYQRLVIIYYAIYRFSKYAIYLALVAIKKKVLGDV